MAVAFATEEQAWARYLDTLRHDTMPKHAEGWRDQYEQVELFAWARLQEDLGAIREHDPE